ncbi:hypothetical protein AOLI_G00202670 [Acnodon oligacanthus]
MSTGIKSVTERPRFEKFLHRQAALPRVSSVPPCLQVFNLFTPTLGSGSVTDSWGLVRDRRPLVVGS